MLARPAAPVGATIDMGSRAYRERRGRIQSVTKIATGRPPSLGSGAKRHFQIVFADSGAPDVVAWATTLEQGDLLGDRRRGGVAGCPGSSSVPGSVRVSGGSAV